MRSLLSATALLCATAAVSADKRDLCADGSVDDNGNWYCQKVQAITYTGVGGHSSYNKVTNMDSGSGACSSSPFGYSGNISPLDEGVSMHFRGPLSLKKFAVYMPGPSSSTKKARRNAHQRRHAHGNAHAHQHHARDAAVGDMVTATIDGVVQTWINEYSGQATSAPAAAAPSSSSAPAVAVVADSAAPAASSSSPAASASPSSGSGSIGSTSGGWSRQAYYDSSSATASGLTFLNHNGGSGSGVFDYTFGNSLSYASSSGNAGASSPQVLADTTLASSNEVIIMSDKQCSDDDGCGYVRPGTVAYHGFEGAEKAFFIEFGMPDSGETSASMYDPVNMPAVWMLNAQIPNTLQYGPADCSCWTSGCGEFDIFEVLAPGDKRCKSTLHGNVQGGDSDYFARPTSGTIKAAVVMYNDNIHIKILDAGTEFGESVDAGTINDICGSTLSQSKLVSLFNLVSS